MGKNLKIKEVSICNEIMVLCIPNNLSLYGAFKPIVDYGYISLC